MRASLLLKQHLPVVCSMQATHLPKMRMHDEHQVPTLVAQAGPFLHRELAFLLVAGRHRHDDVDHHRDRQGPGIEGDHQTVSRVENGRACGQCRPIDRDGDAIGGEAAAESRR
jgi:hypothetical protein